MQTWQLQEEAVEPHHPRVLRSDEGAERVILIALSEGDALQEHQVHEHAMVTVISGRLRVDAGGHSHELQAPALVHFEPAERHEVRALTPDCRILIFLAPWPGEGHPNRR